MLDFVTAKSASHTPSPLNRPAFTLKYANPAVLNQDAARRAPRGAPKTAVSDTSSWRWRTDQSNPAPRSSVVGGRASPPPSVGAGPGSGADTPGGGSVLDRSQPVVKGFEADARLGQLALGRVVAVGRPAAGRAAYDHNVINAGPLWLFQKYRYQ